MRIAENIDFDLYKETENIRNRVREKSEFTDEVNHYFATRSQGIDGDKLPFHKTDQLIGLKENVIIGHMIPAGTGMKRYNNIDVFREQYGDLDRDMEDPEVAALEEGTGGFSAFSVDREQNTIAVEVTDRKDLERDLDEEDFPDEEDIEEEKE